MELWKLRLSMVATLAVIFGLSTLVFSLVLTWAGTFNLLTIGILVVTFNIVQWLIAPYLVGAIYKVREMKQGENPRLQQMVADLSRKSGINTPKLMLAQIPMPNAFAYGSPISGSRVAVTQGLLSNLNEGEVEAVLGHELGHLKHRDVQVMMVVSFLPALCYYIGYSLLLSGMFGGRQSRDNNGGGALIGIAFMAFSWVLNLFTLHVSRLREYYADRHSVSVVDNGANKLSTGLAKIVHASARTRKSMPRQQQESQSFNGFKSLFIANPETAQADSEALNYFESNRKLVDDILAKKITFGDRLIEALSTHPNIVKRLRALQELSGNPYA
ncbi:MAG: zinc metalloprotease HtpX [Candidatus Bathyarchaeota archaeon]|nr:zinc metalloprotease HtpX [Candidatus Bathyarchaeota archaeon]